MSGLILELSKDESRAFFEILNSELRRLANEYDDDTGRIPGKRRMKARPALDAVLKRWASAQPTVPETDLVVLDEIRPCSVFLSETERKTCGGVIRDGLKRMEKDLADAPAVLTGVYAEIRRTADAAETISAALGAA